MRHRPDSDLPSVVLRSDTPLSELATPALFLVNCFRLLTLAILAPQSGMADWRQGFVAARVPAAGALALEAVTGFLLARTPEELDLRCPGCPRLGGEEARLIAVLGALQRSEEPLARTLLELWMPPAMGRLALSPARSLAAALADAGLRLQADPRRQPRPHLVPRAGDRGLRLLH